MKKTGIILLIIGLALVLFTGLSVVGREKMVDIGKFEISAKKNYSISWSPLIGAIGIVAGAALYLLGRKNSTSI